MRGPALPASMSQISAKTPEAQGYSPDRQPQPLQNEPVFQAGSSPAQAFPAARHADQPTSTAFRLARATPGQLRAKTVGWKIAAR